MLTTALPKTQQLITFKNMNIFEFVKCKMQQTWKISENHQFILNASTQKKSMNASS
jgi:hypothetical protein